MVRALRSINSRASGRRPQRALARLYVARRGGRRPKHARCAGHFRTTLPSPPRQPPRIPRRHDEIAARKQLRIVRVVMARARPKQLANNNRDELIGSVDDTNGPIQRGYDRMHTVGRHIERAWQPQLGNSERAAKAHVRLRLVEYPHVLVTMVAMFIAATIGYE